MSSCEIYFNKENGEVPDINDENSVGNTNGNPEGQPDENLDRAKEQTKKQQRRLEILQNSNRWGSKRAMSKKTINAIFSEREQQQLPSNTKGATKKKNTMHQNKTIQAAIEKCER